MRLTPAALAGVLALVLSGCSGGAGAGSDGDPGTLGATSIEATGSVRTHDPSLVIDDLGTPETADDVWYVYSTGNGAVGRGAPEARRSHDQGQTWESLGTTWGPSDDPSWVREIVVGLDNYWAPEVYEHEGTYYLYWSASTFGSNTSVIGLFTSPTLDPDDPAYGWVDQGEVWRSEAGSPYNAIDPAIVTAADGTPWMAFGSFWDGLFMLELAWPDGKVVGYDPVDPTDPGPRPDPVPIADRGIAPNAIEAAYVYERDGWYYLFHSRDSCCKGTGSTYNIAVGRSKDVTGPYVDDQGISLLEGGGLSLLFDDRAMIGPGGQSVAIAPDGDAVLAFHFYDADLDGDFRLALRVLDWTDDGWPVAHTAERLAELAD